jgi:hypothetical protein
LRSVPILPKLKHFHSSIEKAPSIQQFVWTKSSIEEHTSKNHKDKDINRPNTFDRSDDLLHSNQDDILLACAENLESTRTRIESKLIVPSSAVKHQHYQHWFVEEKDEIPRFANLSTYNQYQPYTHAIGVIPILKKEIQLCTRDPSMYKKRTSISNNKFTPSFATTKKNDDISHIVNTFSKHYRDTIVDSFNVTSMDRVKSHRRRYSNHSICVNVSTE